MSATTPQKKRTRTKLTPPEIAAAYGCKTDKVLAWIRSGELRAVNIAQAANGERPRYRIDPADLEAFESRRATAPQPKPSTPRRRNKQEPDGYARY